LQDAEQTGVQGDEIAMGNPPSSWFAPYPNENSFLLGDWYWNDGVQKSKHSFKQLVDIISSPSFRPADVRGTGRVLVDGIVSTSGTTYLN
jgi:hypothetical protein